MKRKKRSVGEYGGYEEEVEMCGILRFLPILWRVTRCLPLLGGLFSGRDVSAISAPILNPRSFLFHRNFLTTGRGIFRTRKVASRLRSWKTRPAG
jgi:hypothetical protein